MVVGLTDGPHATRSAYSMTRDPSSVEIVPRAKIPAWGVSVVLHALLMILFALWIPTRRATSIEEQDRPVGIVLSKTDEQGEVEYFQDQPTASQAAPASAAPADPLPDVKQPPLDVDQFLPGDAVPVPAAGDGDSPLAAVDLRNRGRPLAGLGQGNDELAGDEPAVKKGPTGPKTTLALFGGVKATGNRFVFVIDRSQSMGASGLAVLPAAKEELKRALDGLDGRHRFQIMAYNNSISYCYPDGLQPADAQHKLAAEKFIGGITARSSTKHYLAIARALAMKPRPDVIFVLTDADQPYPTGNELVELRRRSGGHTTINVVQFGDGPLEETSNFFMRLADATGGTYGYVDTSRLRHR